MAIIEKGQGVNVGETEIPDNVSGSLIVSSSDGSAVITVDTSDGAEITRLSAAGAAGVEVHATNAGGDNNAEVRLADEVGFIADPDCMIRRSNSNELEFRFVSTDIFKINVNGAYVENGNFGVGTVLPAHKAHVQDGDLGIVTNNANDATAKSLIFKRSKSNTDGTAVVVADDDILGNIEFQGAEDGDSYATGAKIFARVNGTPGNNNMPTELVFETTPEGSETPTTRMTIGASGVIATTASSGGVFTFNRDAKSVGFRIDSNIGLNTSGGDHLEIMHGFKRVADFDGETLLLQNTSSTSNSSTSGGLWVNLSNTCTSSGTDNKTIASTAHGLQAGDAVSLPSGSGGAYEVFKVFSRDSANQFTVDSALANSISSAIGKTDGVKLQVKTGHGESVLEVNGNGATTIISGHNMLTLKEDTGLTRHYFNDGNYHGIAGSGSARTRLSTDTATGSYLRYSPLHLGDELTSVDVAMLHPIVGADVNTDMPVIKVEQLNTTHNPYAIEINNTGSGDSIHDDSGAKLTAAGVWTDASDVLHKEDIVDIPYGLAEVLQMQPRKYKLKKTGEEDIGFISQEMETIIPEVVFGDDAVMQDKVVDVAAKPAKLTDDGEEIDPAREEKARFNVPTSGKSLSYSHLTAVLVKAVQELTARVAELETGD